MTDQVLIVDDSEAIRSALGARLEEAGFSVESAPDGKAGLAALDHCHPVCILLDLVMPVMGGFEFLRAIRHAMGAMPPVIVITSYEDDTIRDRARRLGAIGLLSKDDALRYDFPLLLARMLNHNAASNGSGHHA